ncbi:MAG: 50S ribosomal protein L18 [Candidatus Altiarchaeota archaeon]
MAYNARYKVDYRRKREGKTNYKKRLGLLKSGKSRLVVRKSNRYITAQIVDYNAEGDKVVLTTRSSELKKFNWRFSMKNTPAAYLTGLIIGYKAKAKDIKSAILDIGLQKSTKGSCIYSLVKGAIDAGLEIPVGEEIFPDEDRITGKVISDYRKNDEIMKNFEETKNLIEEKLSNKNGG